MLINELEFCSLSLSLIKIRSDPDSIDYNYHYHGGYMSLYNLAKENRKQKDKVENSRMNELLSFKSRPAYKLKRINLPPTADIQLNDIEIESEDELLSEEIPVADKENPKSIPTRTTGLTDQQKDYFNLLTKYIPTESITLYVAFMSAIPAFKKDFTFLTPTLLYWFFALLTPALFLLWDFGQYKQTLKTNSSIVYSFPWWNVIASLIAFMCWALAVPNSPYLSSESGGVLAALLALFISTILGLIERIIK